ncbi:MAG: putative permease [Rickettsiales bacterium]|jgi:predicted PurR-regulated permease PerM|nr:putative permease [Rickettsiales bacterium]
MTAKEKVIIAVISLLAFCLFFYLIRSILLPFAVGLMVAYFLDPAADKLESFGMSRLTATGIITSLFFSTILLGGVLLIPMAYHQFISFTQAIPEYAAMIQTRLVPTALSAVEKIDPHAVEKLETGLSNLSGSILTFTAGLLGNIWKSGVAVLNLISLLFITPVITFYMLRDWDTITAKVNGWLPPKYAPTIREQLQHIDNTLSGYIRGQTNVCLLLGIFYAIGLMIVGLDFGLFIGLGTGILAFIPYVGLATGMLIGLGVAFFQFHGLEGIGEIGAVLGVFLVGQVIEGNFLTPKLVGEKVGLHPAWIIFGMLAGAALFGFVGILIAVPVTAVVGVLIRFSIARYLESSLYQTTPRKKPRSRNIADA